MCSSENWYGYTFNEDHFIEQFYNHVLSTLDWLYISTVILTSSNQEEPTVWSPETRNGEVPCLGPLVHFASKQKPTLASCGKLEPKSELDDQNVLLSFDLKNVRKPNWMKSFPRIRVKINNLWKPPSKPLVSPLLAAAQRSKPPTTFHGILVDS